MSFTEIWNMLHECIAELLFLDDDDQEDHAI